MIPKVIYTTWISDKPIPEKFHKYIESWKHVMPDYKIHVISMDNVKHGKFVDEAIKRGKFAVAGHYARCQELYENGGIYFDIDIEAVKPFDALLREKIVVGREDDDIINNAVIACHKGDWFMAQCMSYMDKFNFDSADIELETGPRMFTKLYKGKTFPPEYFYPYHYTEQFTHECIKQDTYCIHHWAGSWQPDVSIVIPCWNQAQYLPDAIESALNQTYKSIEVIVVNDGSPDNTSEVARKYPVILVEQENKGLSGARNEGIKRAKGKWVLTLDADDKIAPDFIEKTIGKDDIVATEQQEFGDSSCHWTPPHDHPKYENFKEYNCINCCSLFKKEIWHTVGGYDEQMKSGYEDWDFWLRATKRGYTVSVVREPLFFYRKHGRSMVSDAIAKHNEIYSYMIQKDAEINGS